MKQIRAAALGAAFALGFLGWVAADAQDKAMDMAATADHLMFTPEGLSWSDGPASLPRGAQMTVLTGDPTKEGPFTMRIKAPANFRIPPHWHPADEQVTVIQGTFYMGLGERFDDAALRMIPTGGFTRMKAGTRHFAKTGNTETVLQLHGIGPWGINYVNADEDPRKAK